MLTGKRCEQTRRAPFPNIGTLHLPHADSVCHWETVSTRGRVCTGKPGRGVVGMEGCRPASCLPSWYVRQTLVRFGCDARPCPALPHAINSSAQIILLTGRSALEHWESRQGSGAKLWFLRNQGLFHPAVPPAPAPPPAPIPTPTSTPTPTPLHRAPQWRAAPWTAAAQRGSRLPLWVRVGPGGGRHCRLRKRRVPRLHGLPLPPPPPCPRRAVRCVCVSVVVACRWWGGGGMPTGPSDFAGWYFRVHENVRLWRRESACGSPQQPGWGGGGVGEGNARATVHLK